jgi:hypothetical protein
MAYVQPQNLGPTSRFVSEFRLLALDATNCSFSEAINPSSE